MIQVAGVLLGSVNSSVIDGSGKQDITATTIEADLSLPPAPLAAAPSHAARLDVASAKTRDVIVAPRASSDNPENDPAANYHNGSAETYRTYCVRLCDGYYWPISFSTTPDRFDDDAAACNSACGTPARLFVHAMPGGGPGTMVALNGLRYSSLKTAFQFRVKYDAQCRCQPQPWEQASLDRHRLFAATDAARKGSKAAQAEVKELTAKIQADRQQADAALKVADAAAVKQLAEAAKSADLEPPRRQRRTAATVRSTDSKPVQFDVGPTAGRGRFIPASGSGRAWTDRVFNGN